MLNLGIVKLIEKSLDCETETGYGCQRTNSHSSVTLSDGSQGCSSCNVVKNGLWMIRAIANGTKQELQRLFDDTDICIKLNRISECANLGGPAIYTLYIIVANISKHGLNKYMEYMIENVGIIDILSTFIKTECNSTYTQSNLHSWSTQTMARTMYTIRIIVSMGKYNHLLEKGGIFDVVEL